MLLDELAKELVENTSALVGGRTINIMDPKGIIIASTEPERVGSYHQGAREAAQTGKMVCIYRDQLDRYPGAKEGCNMPLRLGGSIIGVVGIYGDPDQIRDVAHLLDVYATKYYQLEAMLRPRMAENAMRIQLLLNLLSPSAGAISVANGLLEKLDIQFQYPIHTVVVSAGADMPLPENGEQLHRLLDSLGFQRKHRDVWGIVENRMVLLCSDCPDRRVDSLRALNQEGYRVSLGMPSPGIHDIQTAYDQASILAESGPGAFNDMTELATRCHYLISRTAGQEKPFLEQRYQALLDVYGEVNGRAMLESIQAYYDCQRSVTEAARQQFVHKNTLQYRVKRVLEALGLTDLPAFYQEYLVRLLLEHVHRKSGSQDLEK